MNKKLLEAVGSAVAGFAIGATVAVVVRNLNRWSELFASLVAAATVAIEVYTDRQAG
jgi:hypothetical protein